MKDEPNTLPDAPAKTPGIKRWAGRFLMAAIAILIMAYPAVSELSDIWTLQSGNVDIIRVTASPALMLIPASPNGVTLGNTSYPFANVYASSVSGLTGVVSTSAAGNVMPSVNATYSLGNSTRQWLNMVGVNLTLSGESATTGNSVVTGVHNITGLVTTNGIVANTTINSTGLATLDNCTVNGTLTAVDTVLSGLANVTGLTTLNNLVANGTINSTGLATLDNCTVNGTTTTVDVVASGVVNATGTTTLNAVVGNSTINSTGLATLDNCTVNGTMTAVDAVLSGLANITGLTTLNNLVANGTINGTGTATFNAIVGNSTINSTGLATLNNCTVNGSLSTGTNLTCGQILALAKTTVNSTNTTLSGNTSYVALVNMSGNHTLTLPDPAAAGTGAIILIADMITSIGTTGNLTVNATAGNINNIDAYTVTNTSGATGNVSLIQCISDGADWTLGVIRR